jgi:adenylate kinase
MKLIFLGPPGAGKGTVAKIAIKEFNIIQISTGDLFRYEIKEETPLGLKVASILEKGDLVPDELTIEIVKQRTLKSDCANGYILDGFPRTINQAVAWEEADNIDKVVLFNVTEDVILRRLGGRRICPKCGAIYNIYTLKPKNEGYCDKDNEKLIIRKDDQETAIINRLNIYNNDTKPLIDFYKNLGKIVEIDANVDADKSFEQIRGKLS